MTTIINGILIDSEKINNYKSLIKYNGKTSKLPYRYDILKYIFSTLGLTYHDYINSNSDDEDDVFYKNVNTKDIFDIKDSYNYYHLIRTCNHLNIKYDNFMNNLNEINIDILCSLYEYLNNENKYIKVIKELDNINNINDYEDKFLIWILNQNPNIIIINEENIPFDRLRNILVSLDIDSAYDYIEESYNFYKLIKLCHKLGISVNKYLIGMENKNYDPNVLLSLYYILKDYDEYKASIYSIKENELENIGSIYDHILSYIIELNPDILFKDERYKQIPNNKLYNILKKCNFYLNDLKKYYYIIIQYLQIKDIIINLEEIDEKNILPIIRNNKISLHIDLAIKIEIIDIKTLKCKKLLYPIEVGSKLLLYNSNEYDFENDIKDKYYEIKHIIIESKTNNYVQNTIEDCIIILDNKILIDAENVYDDTLEQNDYHLLIRLDKKYYDI